MNSALRFILLLCFSYLAPLNISAQCGQNYDRDVRRIVKAAERLPHEKTRIVFAGSSTFRLWNNMAESFPEYEVVNAGIGGSCFDDLYRYKEQLISATNPDILVIYEGDNDIVHVEEDGDQREIFDIHSDAWNLLNWIQYTHPELPVFLLSTKTFSFTLGTLGEIQGREQYTRRIDAGIQLPLHGLLALADR